MMYKAFKKLNIYLCLCLVFTGKVGAQNLTKTNTYFLEAEQFQFAGGWDVKKGFTAKDMSGGGHLGVRGGFGAAGDAITAIKIKIAGNYVVWTRSSDNTASQQGKRLFKLYVNDLPMDIESGKHGVNGYYWEKVGSMKLKEGEVVFTLKDTRHNYARCDAILISSNENFNPNDVGLSFLQAFKVIPEKKILVSAIKASTFEPICIQADAKVVAELSNDKIRVKVVSSGKPEKLLCKTEIKSGDEWVSIDPNVEDNTLFLLSSAKPDISFSAFNPAWNGSIGASIFESGGKTYSVLDKIEAQNPFLSGQLIPCTIAGAVKQSSEKMEITYLTQDGETIKTMWHLQEADQHFKLSLSYTPKKTAYYSFVFNAFQGITKDKISNVQLPPLFQFQRTPKRPLMVSSTLTPQPICIVETKVKDSLVSMFIAAVPEALGTTWGTGGASKMGFSLTNANNLVQPVGFAPVLGIQDSKIKADELLKSVFVIGAFTGKWNNALEYFSDRIFKVEDYRRQEITSLTDAAFNMVDLVKNDTASGWNAELKAYTDIEGDPERGTTVVNPSPLAIVSVAVMAKDEDLYITKALPIIEYTLSRNGFRFTKPVPGGTAPKFSPYESQFNTAYFEGLHKLLNEANPWIATLALPNNLLRTSKGYVGDLNDWAQALAAYRLTKDRLWLDKAVIGAEKFLKTEVYGIKTAPLGHVPFYNVSYYPFWFNLPDLYEATGKKEFLKASQYGAFFTIAGIRSYPVIENSTQVIHPKNTYNANSLILWKGDKRYRLGFPRKTGDVLEKTVPDYLTSPVGLGLEQPVTFFSGGGLNHVYMSSWAPALLRLHHLENHKLFETYARNSTIGRFSNYPGYYASGYTDLVHSPKYPYVGPDVTSIYYHHIQSHIAFTLDFLITEAVQRSKGKINFPWSKQEGFVWFNNRIYGGGRGNVLNENGLKLWMKKGLITLNSPEINYITGNSADNFIIILLNEADTDKTVSVKISNEIQLDSNTDPVFYESVDSKAQKINITARILSAKVPAKGLSVVSVPTKRSENQSSIAPVKEGMKIIDLGAFGKFYAFRIRSPFGWDSFYGYFSNTLPAGMTTKLEVNGQSINTGHKAAYPNEWSLTQIKPDEAIDVGLFLSPETKEVKRFSVLLPGIIK